MNFQPHRGMATTYAEGAARLKALREQIAEARREMRKIQESTPAEPVKDYVLAGKDGEVQLSELFGEKDELFVIHNMGTTCTSCTMWADGFNGVYQHLADRAAFVVSSPDAPDVQQKFAESRGWRFPMVSHAGTTFAADMGYLGENRRPRPGVSVFRRQDGEVVRIADTKFEIGDDFCPVWHMFDLLPDGAADWRPKFHYG
jgi:predicted dithiol-disulfide oxidoreductase (DUF899 family)